MAVSFRKTKKLTKNTNLNINKWGVGISTGVKGARISTNTKGKSRLTLGIPGTGIRYSTSMNGTTGIIAVCIGFIVGIYTFIFRAIFGTIKIVCKLFAKLFSKLVKIIKQFVNDYAKKKNSDDSESL